MNVDPTGRHWYYLFIDDLLEVIIGLYLAAIDKVYDDFSSMYPDLSDEMNEVNPTNSADIPSASVIAVDILAETPIVLDFSIQGGAFLYGKIGFTYVFDYHRSISNWYFHTGAGLGSSTGVSPTIGIGIPHNVQTAKDYSKWFIDVGVNYGWGYDYCWMWGGASADSITFGSPTTGIYGGLDYYWLLGSD